jgi:hypothetical protein
MKICSINSSAAGVEAGDNNTFISSMVDISNNSRRKNYLKTQT